MKNQKQLQDLLSRTLEELDNDKIDINKAIAISRVAGVKIACYREQLKYKKMSGKPTKLDFFE